MQRRVNQLFVKSSVESLLQPCRHKCTWRAFSTARALITTDGLRRSQATVPTQVSHRLDPVLKTVPLSVVIEPKTTLRSIPTPPPQEGNEASTLVYCAMNNRTYDAHSKEVQFLTSVGFGVDQNRHIAVSRPQVLSQLAISLREAATEELLARVVKDWPRWFRSHAGNILNRRNIAPDDVPAALQDMLERRLKMFHLRKASMDIQNAVGSTGTSAQTDIPDKIKVDDSIQHALNPEQQGALDLAAKGYNMYIGGAAGTGKTVLIRAIVRKLQSMGVTVAVTATTGIAGCHIGGSTFHHALGVTINNEFVRRQDLRGVNVVIIDEVSMMSQRLFEEFDEVARAETGCTDIPFGGIQVICCGDFLQLGAIKERSILHSKVFLTSFVKFKLTTQVRQSEHPKFAHALSIMRRGTVTEELLKGIKTLPPGSLEPNAVNLLPTNADVAEANAKELARLEGDPITFNPLPQPPRVMKRTSATLVLQVTPPLVFQREQLISLIIDKVSKKASWPRNAAVSVYKQHQDAYAVRIVYPDAATPDWCDAANTALLELAPILHTTSIGVRLFEVYQDASGRQPIECDDALDTMLAKHPYAQSCTFKVGCRVLLRSNLTTSLPNGTIGTVVGFAPCTPDSIPSIIRDRNTDDLVEKYRQFCEYEGMSEALLPIVRFYSGEELVVPPVECSVGGTLVTEFYSASRIALPLTLAYAFTVHKVQGLTLVGRVHLELSKMWPCDHLLYVAMSRVKNPDQLSMSGFDPSMVRADAIAVDFDDCLPAVSRAIVPPSVGVSVWKAMDLQGQSGKSMDELLRGLGFEQQAVTIALENSTSAKKGKRKSTSTSPLDATVDSILQDNSTTVKSKETSAATTSTPSKQLLKIVKLAEKMRERRRSFIAATVIGGTKTSSLSEPKSA